MNTGIDILEAIRLAGRRALGLPGVEDRLDIHRDYQLWCRGCGERAVKRERDYCRGCTDARREDMRDKEADR